MIRLFSTCFILQYKQNIDGDKKALESVALKCVSFAHTNKTRLKKFSEYRMKISMKIQYTASS